MQRSLSQRAERDIEDAKKQADEIARQQQEIADAVRKLPASGAERQQQARPIIDKKNQLEAKLGELEADLDRGAREASREERPASRKMLEAAGAIRDNRLRDAVKYSQALVTRGRPEQANAAEGDISKGIEEVRQRLEEAQAALGQGQPGDNKRAEALERAERLARRAESMQERTRERAQANGQQGQQARGQQGQQQGRDGQQGREGQQGRDGQQGQQGQQGREGQQGQGQGQQGQNGQGQGQGQQGQQGQGQGGQQGTGQNGQGGGDGGASDGRFGGDRTGGFDRGGARVGDGDWGGWWNGGPVRLTAEDIRQLRGEARQFTQDAQALRGMLRGENIDPRELDEIVRAIRQLEDERTYQDVQELARLQSFVAESLKRFEFGLRRKVDADKNAIALTGSDEVPEEFRKLVEQYYRSLARSPR